MSPSRTATIASLGIAQTLAWASSYYLPAMLATSMARDLGVSTQTVFAGFSVALVVSALLGPAAGKAIDRHGDRPVLAGILHTLGAVAFLGIGVPAGALFTVLHGAGNGVLTIAKGTLPLVLFGAKKTTGRARAC